jgi:hypothetical protein
MGRIARFASLEPYLIEPDGLVKLEEHTEGRLARAKYMLGAMAGISALGVLLGAASAYRILEEPGHVVAFGAVAVASVIGAVYTLREAVKSYRTGRRLDAKLGYIRSHPAYTGKRPNRIIVEERNAPRLDAVLLEGDDKHATGQEA